MFDLTLISMGVATFIVLALIDNFLLPAIPPFFLSLPLHYLPLFFLAYVTGSFGKTFIAGLIGGLMLMVLPGTYFINFGQFTFDY
jgi:thiamine transporter ThiT